MGGALRHCGTIGDRGRDSGGGGELAAPASASAFEAPRAARRPSFRQPKLDRPRASRRAPCPRQRLPCHADQGHLPPCWTPPPSASPGCASVAPLRIWSHRPRRPARLHSLSPHRWPPAPRRQAPPSLKPRPSTSCIATKLARATMNPPNGPRTASGTIFVGPVSWTDPSDSAEHPVRFARFGGIRIPGDSPMPSSLTLHESAARCRRGG